MTAKNGWFVTHCSRMDHGGCTIKVKVQDGKIIKITGHPNGHLNKGYVCRKAVAAIEKLYHPNRLRYPMKRVGKRGSGEWKKISWDEALDLIADNFLKVKEEYGARAVAFCQGMPKGLEHFVLIRLANVFGSPNVVSVQDLCHAPREVAGFHACGFYPVADLEHPTDLILLWGSNPLATNEEGQICRLLLDRLREGAQLVVIDPFHTELASRANLHLQVKPGADLELAAAFIHIIISEKLYDVAFVNNLTSGFDKLKDAILKYDLEKLAKATWVDPEKIREAAYVYAKAERAMLLWGNAIEHTPRNYETARAMVSLMAITGNLGRRGGNVWAKDPAIAKLGKFVRASVIPNKRKEMIHAHFGAVPGLMTVPPAYFRKAVLEDDPYPVRAAYMQCTNPLLAYADSEVTRRALESLDFLAVADVFLTPTALFADVVLPAATHFEFNDIGHYGLGHGFIVARPKLVDPPEDCWPDMKILNELGRRISPPEFWYDDYEMFLEEVLEPSGIGYEEFVKMGILKGPVEQTDTFRTGSGKVELMPDREFNLFGCSEVDAEFPLLLTCRKDPFYLHSSYRWLEDLRKRSPRPECIIHPDVAQQYGIKSGDLVRIETQHGSMTQYASLSDKIHPSVVMAAYGWWFPESGVDKQYEWRKSNYNMVTSTKDVGKDFGTPLIKGIPCRISRVAD
ncbi:MAG: molybdopterin-dependent oxidoreductase [Deltaproteobacteria bacterium]|nr:molybdopterin-dependent oxidoreductase [Deltaproteobacteria bacterium]MBW2068915.1 molybdopterin-dependent oxidoreductase [Deltaproteobacteria bacterium]